MTAQTRFGKCSVGPVVVGQGWFQWRKGILVNNKRSIVVVAAVVRIFRAIAEGNLAGAC